MRDSPACLIAVRKASGTNEVTNARNDKISFRDAHTEKIKRELRAFADACKAGLPITPLEVVSAESGLLLAGP